MTQGTIVRSISYTADGNTLTDNLGTGAVFTYGYNNDNRMVQASLGGATQASYTLNYLGQRVIKSAVGSGTTHFHYDRGGRLIAESDGSGAVQREYIFLGDTPVAFVTPTGGIDIIHTDHLGTPQKMTDATQAVVWDGGASDPFMMSHLPMNPAMNVRFPGQYYDSETGLHDNYFRDYDPSLGRYVESDPIGLHGGINTYGYVGENPIVRADLEGLWQVTIGAGDGIAGLMTFGRNSGQWNFGVYAGAGAGLMASLDLADSGCKEPGFDWSGRGEADARVGRASVDGDAELSPNHINLGAQLSSPTGAAAGVQASLTSPDGAHVTFQSSTTATIGAGALIFGGIGATQYF